MQLHLRFNQSKITLKIYLYISNQSLLFIQEGIVQHCLVDGCTHLAEDKGRWYKWVLCSEMFEQVIKSELRKKTINLRHHSTPKLWHVGNWKWMHSLIIGIIVRDP